MLQVLVEICVDNEKLRCTDYFVNTLPFSILPRIGEKIIFGECFEIIVGEIEHRFKNEIPTKTAYFVVQSKPYCLGRNDIEMFESWGFRKLADDEIGRV